MSADGLRHWLWVDECRDVCALVETFTITKKNIHELRVTILDGNPSHKLWKTYCYYLYIYNIVSYGFMVAIFPEVVYYLLSNLIIRIITNYSTGFVNDVSNCNRHSV